MMKGLSNLFSKKAPETKKYPEIDELLELAEKTPCKTDKNKVPEVLKPLCRAINIDLETDGKRQFQMKDIDATSPLFAHELKKMILAELIQLGFNEKELKGHQIRFGKKISYGYYFLNLRSQSPLPIDVPTIIEKDVELIRESAMSVIDFASIVKIKGENVVVYYELVLGSIKTRPN